jgi:hypothetical protein
MAAAHVVALGMAPFPWPFKVAWALFLALFLSFGGGALVGNLALHKEIVAGPTGLRITWRVLGMRLSRAFSAARIAAVVCRPRWPHASTDHDYVVWGLGNWHVELRGASRRGTLLRLVTREEATLVTSALGAKGFDARVAELGFGQLRGGICTILHLIVRRRPERYSAPP